MLFFIVNLNFHQCDYGTHPEILLTPISRSNRSLKFAGDGSWTNIRITFDYTYLFDDYSCKSEGQVILFRGSNIKCSADDLRSEAKVQALQTTLNNVKSYLNRLLKVQPFTSFSIPQSDIPGLPLDAKEVSDTDLYIYVYARPFGADSSVLASAAPLPLNDGGTYRIPLGLIYINFRKLGTQSADHTDKDRDLFEVLLHEICHILGISSTLFPRWNDGTGSNNIYQCQKANSQFTILSTPTIKEVIKQRFGLSGDYFSDLQLSNGDNCPIGVELEDGGGSGTSGSHWEFRVYNFELMSGVTHGFTSISDITLAALQDSGWYQVDMSMAEPYFYGDYRSRIGESPWTSFPTGSPTKDFPSGYAAKFSEETKESFQKTGPLFNYRGAAYALGKKGTADCSKAKEFYDPDNTGYYSSSGYSMVDDCTPLFSPYNDAYCVANSQQDITKNKNNKDWISTIGPDSYIIFDNDGSAKCAKMECNFKNELYVYKPGDRFSSRQKCAAANELVFSSLRCPDPKIICGMFNYGFNYNSEERPSYCLSSNPTSSETQSLCASNGVTDTNYIIGFDRLYSLPADTLVILVGSINELDLSLLIRTTIIYVPSSMTLTTNNVRKITVSSSYVTLNNIIFLGQGKIEIPYSSSLVIDQSADFISVNSFESLVVDLSQLESKENIVFTYNLGNFNSVVLQKVNQIDPETMIFNKIFKFSITTATTLKVDTSSSSKNTLELKIGPVNNFYTINIILPSSGKLNIKFSNLASITTANQAENLVTFYGDCDLVADLSSYGYSGDPLLLVSYFKWQQTVRWSFIPPKAIVLCNFDYIDAYLTELQSINQEYTYNNLIFIDPSSSSYNFVAYVPSTTEMTTDRSKIPYLIYHLDFNQKVKIDLSQFLNSEVTLIQRKTQALRTLATSKGVQVTGTSKITTKSDHISLSTKDNKELKMNYDEGIEIILPEDEKLTIISEETVQSQYANIKIILTPSNEKGMIKVEKANKDGAKFELTKSAEIYYNDVDKSDIEAMISTSDSNVKLEFVEETSSKSNTVVIVVVVVVAVVVIVCIIVVIILYRKKKASDENGNDVSKI